jgi:Beta-lactamase
MKASYIKNVLSSYRGPVFPWTHACRTTILAAALSITGISQNSNPTQSNALEGIWSAKIVFAGETKEPVEVHRNADHWGAGISKKPLDVQVNDANVRLSFPSHLFAYRGRFSRDRHSIEGFWIVPPGEIIGGWAIPLRLSSVGGQTWRGTLQIPPDQFTLYLKIFRDSQGSLIGSFRNPELNLIGGAAQFRVSQEGDIVHFDGETRGRKINYEARLLHSPDRLSIRWPDLDRTIELGRTAPEQTSSYFPRPVGKTSYVYQKPAVTGDGWETARASDVGINEDVLGRIVQNVIDSDPAASQPTLMHSILVARRRKLVLEEYFYGYNRDTLHPLRSASKTFTSVMLGAAMMEGAKLGPETKIYELLSGMGPFANPDQRKSQITISHLLTHSAGFACDDNDDASPGNEEVMQTQKQQPNWWKYTLDLPIIRDPGTKSVYCSTNLNLVGAALTGATRAWLPELFDRTIARPLQISKITTGI